MPDIAAPGALQADHPDAIDTAHAGGKGVNLSKLVRAGFRVPDFFILPVAAYRDWIAQDGLADEVLRVQWALDRPDAMEHEAQSLQARLAVLPFPAAWMQVLASGFVAGHRWAARSSGILEDAGETAAAGLQANQSVTVNALTRTDLSQVQSRIASMSAGQSQTFTRPIELIVLGLPSVGPTPSPTPTPIPSTHSGRGVHWHSSPRTSRSTSRMLPSASISPRKPISSERSGFRPMRSSAKARQS